MRPLQLSAMASALLLVAACATDAPPLPSNAYTPPIGGAPDCAALQGRYAENRAKLLQLAHEVEDRHDTNQTASYVSNFIPPAVVFTDSNSEADVRNKQLIAERDQLYQAAKFQQCPLT